MSQFKKISEEVLVAENSVVQVERTLFDTLKMQAAKSPLHRARLCTHKDAQDRLHEMFIVLARPVYIRPHRHFHKTESFHVMEGSSVFFFFDDAGAIEQVIPVGDAASGRPFYIRNDDSRFHTHLITSDFLVFHEITNGPFNRADTIYAPWAPEETDSAAILTFVEKLRSAAAQFGEAR
jgi:cupin fold WbuC family metalloprotein